MPHYFNLFARRISEKKVCCDCGVEGNQSLFSKRQWKFPSQSKRRCITCARNFQADPAKNGRVTREGEIVNKPDTELFDYCFPDYDDYEDAGDEHSDCEWELDGV